MAKLINCVNCGKQVSSVASQCPHCNANLNVIKCPICNKFVSYSEEVHKNCIKEHINRNQEIRQVICPVCGKATNTETNTDSIAKIIDRSNNNIKCVNCGHPIHCTVCALCGRPILVNSNLSVHTDSPVGKYAHRVCRSYYYTIQKRRDAFHQRGSSACFIATAVYNSSSAPNVIILRNFRDSTLLSSSFGMLIITWYYKISPPIAKFLTSRRWLKLVIQYLIIEPLVWMINLKDNLK